MIRIYLRNQQKEAALVELLHGDIGGNRIYVSFPIKGKTRRDRRTGLYKVVKSNA